VLGFAAEGRAETCTATCIGFRVRVGLQPYLHVAVGAMAIMLPRGGGQGGGPYLS